MKRLLIVGAGGYGKQVRDIAETCEYDQIDFLDDSNNSAIGKIKDLEYRQGYYNGCIVAIGNPEIRATLVDKITNLTTIVHPSAVVSKTAKIGQGCVIEANSVINANAVIGEASFVCAGAVVNHDAIVRDCCQIDCNAVVMPGSVVPEKTKIQSCSVWISKSLDSSVE